MLVYPSPLPYEGSSATEEQNRLCCVLHAHSGCLCLVKVFVVPYLLCEVVKIDGNVRQ